MGFHKNKNKWYIVYRVRVKADPTLRERGGELLHFTLTDTCYSPSYILYADVNHGHNKIK